MANWKKVIVSGSSAELSALQVDNLSSGVVTGASGNLTTTPINGSGDIVATTGASGLSHSGSFSGSFSGDGSGLTGLPTTLNISGSVGSGSVDLLTQILSVVGTTNEVETSVSGQTITIGLPDNVTITSNLNVGGNAVITGDLTVNGTTTTINTDNLLIEDKFALFASGSTTATDGGIIVQSDIAGSGYAFGYKASSDRWALEDSLAGTATAFSGTPTAFIASAEYGLASAKPSDATGPSYGGASAGFGNIWVSTDTQDIWIYA
jgi:hypothetical protein